jgi:hypothetical protein
MLLKFSHRNWNLKAQMLNAKVNHATGALVNMRSVKPGANPQISNQPAHPKLSSHS